MNDVQILLEAIQRRDSADVSVFHVACERTRKRSLSLERFFQFQVRNPLDVVVIVIDGSEKNNR